MNYSYASYVTPFLEKLKNETWAIYKFNPDPKIKEDALQRHYAICEELEKRKQAAI